MTEKSLAIVISPNLIGNDLSPTENLLLATSLNTKFEEHCKGLKDKPNPIVKWYKREIKTRKSQSRT